MKLLSTLFKLNLNGKMKLYNNFNIFKNHKKSIILIGNFDGIHLGHQKLFKLASTYKKKFKINIGVLTFEPMPKMFFNQDIKNFRILNINKKNIILKNMGVDFVITKKFDKKFSKIKSDFFIKEILSKKLEAKYIFVSDNFRFGNKREGDVDELIKNEKIYDYKIIKPQPLMLSQKVISSTYIRSLLEKGNLKKTNKLLGKNWSIEGVVQKGRQQGKKIGFPTCNMDIKDQVIAMPGVYAVKVKQKNSNKFLKAIANLGYRPTFNQKKILLEVHIFNFSGNLYNKYLSIEFTKFIRKEKKFKNVNQLKKQIQSDLKVAKRS
jgi:riboflavin kinase/FMN adenylyltransferase